MKREVSEEENTGGRKLPYTNDEARKQESRTKGKNKSRKMTKKGESSEQVRRIN